MKFKRVLAGLLCFLLLAGCMTGCMKVSMKDVTETTVGINADGSVDEVMISDFDQSYYSLEDLEAFAREKINLYNGVSESGDAKQGSDAIVLKSIAQTESTVTLEVTYATPIDYRKFNNVTFEFGTLENMLSGKTLENISACVDAYGSEVTLESLEKPDKLRALYVEHSMVIRTSGKITACSEGCEIIDDHTVRTADGPSVIVFKASFL